MATVITQPTNFEYRADVIGLPTIAGGGLTITVAGAIATVNEAIVNYLYLPSNSLIRKPRANWTYRKLTTDELKSISKYLDKDFSENVVVINVPVRGVPVKFADSKDSNVRFEFKIFAFFQSAQAPTPTQIAQRVRQVYSQLNRPVRRAKKGMFEYANALVDERAKFESFGFNTSRIVNNDLAAVVGYDKTDIGATLDKYLQFGWEPSIGSNVVIELITMAKNSVVPIKRRVLVQNPVKLTLDAATVGAAINKLFVD